MSHAIHVHLLPDLLTPDDLAGADAVVIDILRASTTVCHALQNGAAAVRTFLTPEDAIADAAGRANALLGGERGGVRIEGFQLGNSPFEYTPETVGGKTIVFTTTNGTRALDRCRQAARVLIGAFVNLEAVVGCLSLAERPVHLVCAGTNGAVTAEDVLFAGAAAARLLERSPESPLGNDSARLALDFFRWNSQNDAQLQQALADSRGGRNLQRLGLARDIVRAGQRNLFDFVPVWDPQTNTVTPDRPLTT